MADGKPLLDGEARYLPAFTRFDRNGDGNISEDAYSCSILLKEM